MAEFPNRIRHFRKARGWTLEYVALEIDTSITHVSLLEKGQRALTQQWMRRFADLFGVTPGELLPESENAYNLAPDERDLIDRYRSASSEQRQTFARVSEAILPYAPEPPDLNDQTNQRAA
jgi:transcriptional regulator with XRE-family HTH domain